MIPVSSVYAHPDIVFVGGGNGDTHYVMSTSLDQAKKSNNTESVQFELFSDEWFWQNFILLLSGSIASIMVVTVFVVFKTEKN